jgi:hypothetical protein
MDIAPLPQCLPLSGRAALGVVSSVFTQGCAVTGATRLPLLLTRWGDGCSNPRDRHL